MVASMSVTWIRIFNGVCHGRRQILSYLSWLINVRNDSTDPAETHVTEGAD